MSNGNDNNNTGREKNGPAASDQAGEATSEIVLTQKNCKVLAEHVTEEFLKLMDKMIANGQADKEHFALSMRELGLAGVEIQTDLSFIAKRRQLSNGVSLGKIAGVMLYRLTRHHLLQCTHPLMRMTESELDNLSDDERKENEETLEKWANLQVEVAIDVVCRFLKISHLVDWISKNTGHDPAAVDKNAAKKEAIKLPNVMQELKYLIQQRHYNQETLGLFFDSLLISGTFAKTLKSEAGTKG